VKLERKKNESDLLLKWVAEAGAWIQRNILLLKFSLIRFYNYSTTTWIKIMRPQK